jgi:hypothetical protein
VVIGGADEEGHLDRLPQIPRSIARL